MRNWTENNRQTGVGNALKRHYQNFLWEYEIVSDPGRAWKEVALVGHATCTQVHHPHNSRIQACVWLGSMHWQGAAFFLSRCAHTL